MNYVLKEQGKITILHKSPPLNWYNCNSALLTNLKLISIIILYFKGPDDRQITVTFANGKTEKVPMDVAIWTPEQVYERLTLELKMPKEARLSLQNQEPNYPKENLEGYPTSGPSAEPSEYPFPNPFHFQHDPVFLDSLPWGNGYIPAYPPAQRQPQPCEVRLQTKSSVKSEDINKLVPGSQSKMKINESSRTTIYRLMGIGTFKRWSSIIVHV